MEHSAERVRLSFPVDLSDWGQSTIEGAPFAAYLRRVHDEASEGDVWEEFVGVGCCGDTRDVPLRVESVTDGSQSEVESGTVDDETAFQYEPREETDGGGGWTVQSRAGR